MWCGVVLFCVCCVVCVVCVVLCVLCCVVSVVRLGNAENPPCVDSKRFRVCVRDASVCTGKTPACVGHAGVFKAHTEAP